MRKEVKEGHIYDVVADSVIRIVLEIIFCLRGEKQFVLVRKMLEGLVYGHVESTTCFTLLTSDRGYDEDDYGCSFEQMGFSFLFFMPELKMRLHPFVSSSRLAHGM